MHRPPNSVFLFGIATILALAATATPARAQQNQAAPADPAGRWWQALATLCGSAHEGRVEESVPPDTVWSQSRLVIHGRECSDSVIRIPLHVGPDRSRTWVFTRTAAGVRLQHDHRHEDGTPDAVTMYGGDSRPATQAGMLEFGADAHTARLIPAAATNVWTVELEPGVRLVYRLRREGTERKFRAVFDLSRFVQHPPPPWGAAPRGRGDDPPLPPAELCTWAVEAEPPGEESRYEDWSWVVSRCPEHGVPVLVREWDMMETGQHQHPYLLEMASLRLRDQRLVERLRRVALNERAPLESRHSALNVLLRYRYAGLEVGEQVVWHSGNVWCPGGVSIGVSGSLRPLDGPLPVDRQHLRGEVLKIVKEMEDRDLLGARPDPTWEPWKVEWCKHGLSKSLELSPFE